LLKQESKARNVLKRLNKLPFRSEDADEFEKAWLVMADMYIQSGKFDVAKEFCQQCLSRNKSCSKVWSTVILFFMLDSLREFQAWEHRGLIAEKEQNFSLAAES
jgi:tetratricopeptide (TPR) repeat protein